MFRKLQKQLKHQKTSRTLDQLRQASFGSIPDYYKPAIKALKGSNDPSAIIAQAEKIVRSRKKQ